MITIMTMMLLYFSQARSIWIAFLMFLITYKTIGRIHSSKIIGYIYFLIFITSVLLFTFLYPYSSNFRYFNDLNVALIKYTGKTLFSGREVVWVNNIELIKENWLLGFSFSSVVQNDAGFLLSAHNLYLEIMSQVGLLGFLFFLLVLFKIWGRALALGESRGKFLGATLIAILVHQVFEVTWTQNNLAIGIIQWLLIIIGFNRIK
ncbi:O-antigen ligase family protein [Priestia megaterium]|uniref:O-antigen ligase family protein n=1 Tax=Priestia megaterium TaxID=1404 RepID=UPI00366BB513